MGKTGVSNAGKRNDIDFSKTLALGRWRRHVISLQPRLLAASVPFVSTVVCDVHDEPAGQGKNPPFSGQPITQSALWIIARWNRPLAVGETSWAQTLVPPED